MGRTDPTFFYDLAGRRVVAANQAARDALGWHGPLDDVDVAALLERTDLRVDTSWTSSGSTAALTVAPAPATDVATVGLATTAQLVGRLREALLGGAGDVAVLHVEVDADDPSPSPELIEAVGDRLAASVRRTDVVCHVGAGCFAVLCDHVHGEIEAAGLAAELVDDLTRPVHIGGDEVVPVATVAVSLPGDAGMRLADLPGDPDAALEAARVHGRAQHRGVSDASATRSRRQALLARALRLAVECDELDVHYQPVVDLRDGRMLGVEALVRWIPAGGSVILPDRFIPVAERSGVIFDLGRWVLRTACRFAAAHPDVSVAVNVSACQVRADLVDTVLAALGDAGLDPSRLRLELTETALLEDPDLADGVLGKLHDLGVRLSLDDFGTGYSSLAYLRRFPFDGVKIDRAFIRCVDKVEEDRRMVGAVLALARAIDVTVTAEGVESEAQAAVLAELGCVEAQGYLFGRPMPAVDLRRWLAAAATRR